MDNLRQYIKGISPTITNLELDFILTKFTLKQIKKGKSLLRQRQTCRDFAIVKQGCFKIFYTENEKETNAWFAFEMTPVTEMNSFITQKPSQYGIQAIENAEIYAIGYNDLQVLYSQFSAFQIFGLRITEQILVKTIDRLTSFQTESAEMRYQKIFNDPNYTQRLPLKDLASFLGVTPNSLSRLRNNVKK